MKIEAELILRGEDLKPGDIIEKITVVRKARGNAAFPEGIVKRVMTSESKETLGIVEYYTYRD